MCAFIASSILFVVAVKCPASTRVDLLKTAPFFIGRIKGLIHPLGPDVSPHQGQHLTGKNVK